MKRIELGSRTFYIGSVFEAVELAEGFLPLFLVGTTSVGLVGRVTNGDLAKALEEAKALGTFDWAVPQGWLDRQYQRNPEFSNSGWVWEYPPHNLFGQPLYLPDLFVKTFRQVITDMLLVGEPE